MEIELKHIAPYLPYGLKFGYFKNTEPEYYELTFGRYPESINVISISQALDYEKWGAKPILRPLSDLTKEIEHNGEMFVPMEYLSKRHHVDYFVDTDFEQYIIDRLNVRSNVYGLGLYIHFLPNGLVKKLQEWHFDTENLIENGLAVNMNTLKVK